MLDTIYPFVLSFHNLTRWLVLLGGLWSILQVGSGWLTRRAWNIRETNSVKWFSRILGIQFLLGLALYLLPGAFVGSIRQNLPWAQIMANRLYRFFLLEHPSTMFIAIVVANIALSVALRMQRERTRFALVSILLIVSMLLILSAIPWPAGSYARPWLRLPF